MKIQKRIKTMLLTFSCQHYTELASRRLDTELNQFDRLVYWMHHLVCTFCRRSSRQIALIEKGMAKLADENNVALQGESANLSAQVKSKIKEALSIRDSRI